MENKLKKIFSKVDKYTICDIGYYVLALTMIAIKVPLLLFIIAIVSMRVFIELEIRKR